MAGETRADLESCGPQRVTLHGSGPIDPLATLWSARAGASRLGSRFAR